MKLKGKTALISGAGRNNGKAISLTFAKEGAELVLLDKLEKELEQVADLCRQAGATTLPLSADVTKPDDANRAVLLALERFGKVDVVVNAVGMRPHKSIWEFSYDEWHHVFALNCHSTFYLAKAVAPGMIERKSGNIIALGGKVSLTARRYAGGHTSSKHGLYGVIKSLAQDLGPYGIRANLLIPSAIENERLHPEWYPERGGDPNTTLLAETPLGRLGTQQEVANVALFLASDESSYVTGDRIICGGGGYM